MSDGNLLHLGSAVLMFAAAIVPIYLSLRLKSNFRILKVLLAVFIFVHVIYHLAYYAGEEALGEVLFRTISIVVLIIFGIAFISISRFKKEKLIVWWYHHFALTSNFSFYSLFVALGIFVWLACRSHSVKSFQFQISIFILIWIGGEFMTTLHESGLFNLPPVLHDLGMQIHFISMILFASIIFVRFYYSYRAGHKIIESLDSILK